MKIYIIELNYSIKTLSVAHTHLALANNLLTLFTLKKPVWT